jgi:hypothetical protein
MKNAKFIIAIVAVTVLAIAAASAQRIAIDFRYNVGKSDAAGDYFTWTSTGKDVKDTFDTASGASKLKSTAAFDAVWFDGTAVARRQTLPNGFRNLLLYPISPRSVFTEDAFAVTPVGNEFQIRFIHRGVAYQATTKGKKLDVTADFSSAVVGDQVAGEFVIRDAFRKAGTNGTKMSDLDWNKIILLHDTAAANAAKSTTGSLTVAYTGGILTVKGTLTQK